MLSLVLTVLFVNIAIYLVNTIGASTIDNLVRFPAILFYFWGPALGFAMHSVTFD